MSRASLTIDAGRSRAARGAGPAPAGSGWRAASGSRARHDEVRGHHRGDPGLDRRGERHQLAGGAGWRGRRRRRAARGGCPARCRRGPGSAWRRPRRPVSCSPVDPGGDVRRDPVRVGAEAAGADDRVVRVAVDVGHRAEVEVDARPRPARRRPRGPASRVRPRSSAAPSAAAPEHRAARSRACSRVTSPPSSSTATTRARRGGVDGAVSAATASGPSAVLLPKRQTPPRPAASRSATSGASVVPAKAGQQHPQRQRSRSTVLIPSPPRP